MPPKTPKKILRDVLENLDDMNLKKFCSDLLDRDKRVKKNQVNNKDRQDVADVMMDVYDREALKVAEQLLRGINCEAQANDLAEEAKKASSDPVVSVAAAAAVRSAGSPPAARDGKHFVDKHKTELIKRVGNIDPILDELQDAEVIEDEAYHKICAIATNQGKIRELYKTCLNAEATKDIFYNILKKKEKFLIQELEGK